MNFKEFESFSKEFYEILVFLEDDEATEEVLKLIALWVVSHGKMHLEIEKDLLYLFDLAGSIEFKDILLRKSKRLILKGHTHP